MINLDDKNAILTLQGGDAVLNSIDAFPKQCQQGWEQARKIQIPQDYKQITSVVVCGMGGSRFPTIIIKELYKEQLTVPIVINDDYNLPGYVNKNTLVILSSYSGTTEEVIACGKKALSLGAKLMGISSGGEIAQFLKENNAPYYVFDPTYNPSGQPRIGFGYAVGGQLGLMHNADILKVDEQEITDGLNDFERLLADFKIDVPAEKNHAKKMAQDLYQKYPYYTVSEFLTGIGNAVANQTNETAKSISTFRIIPELNHHLMEGLKFPDAIREIMVFVFFYSGFYSPSIQKRFHITKDVVEQNKITTLWHELKGRNKIEQAFELMGFGNYMTMYLSTLYEQDPKAIPYVDYFKKKLKE